MKIAILGIRGVPAKYGGLETCAEEIGSRLASRGHDVTCYCRKGEDDTLAEYRGIRRIILPSLRYTITDTYTHSLFACCHVVTQRPDVILAFNPAISTLCIIPKLFGNAVVLNPNGFDWRRPKWGWFAKRFIYVSAFVAAKLCDKLIIDAKSVCDYYAEDFDCDPIHIPNGANIDPEPQHPELLQQYGLEKDSYYLFLSRHVPDNSCDLIIRAFEKSRTQRKLFMGGGEASDSDYAASLRETKDPRIIFPGAIYNPDHVKELHHGAYAVVHGNQPGGTSLGLLKALGYGTCVLTLGTPDNAYVVQDAGLTYKLSEEDLMGKINYLEQHPERVAELRRMAVARCQEGYSWDRLADDYENVLKAVARPRKAAKMESA
ncbi:MAG: glycosyltransferase [Candidatus Hydrogenedentes bacterium]|nr:glycosyltransferase [Candidatus Hydrogenedentota bacterium]